MAFRKRSSFAVASVFAALVLVPSCKDKKESQFSAANAQFDKSCGEANGITTGQLMTRELSNETNPKLLSYELSLVDCAGKAWPIQGDILFDLNVVRQPGVEQLTYTVKDAATQSPIANGTLQTVEGSDLFGQTGGGFAHHKAAGVSIATNVTKIIFEVNVGAWRLMPANPTADFAAPFYDIESFLRLGQAKPVTAMIHVTNGATTPFLK
jgi:hypothetical protein